MKTNDYPTPDRAALLPFLSEHAQRLVEAPPGPAPVVRGESAYARKDALVSLMQSALQSPNGEVEGEGHRDQIRMELLQFAISHPDTARQFNQPAVWMKLAARDACATGNLDLGLVPIYRGLLRPTAPGYSYGAWEQQTPLEAAEHDVVFFVRWPHRFFDAICAMHGVRQPATIVALRDFLRAAHETPFFRRTTELLPIQTHDIVKAIERDRADGVDINWQHHVPRATSALNMLFAPAAEAWTWAAPDGGVETVERLMELLIEAGADPSSSNFINHDELADVMRPLAWMVACETQPDQIALKLLTLAPHSHRGCARFEAFLKDIQTQDPGRAAKYLSTIAIAAAKHEKIPPPRPRPPRPIF